MLILTIHIHLIIKSVADAGLYRTVGDLLITESSGREVDGKHSGSIPTMAIVSARGGMTDLLVAVVDSALQDINQAEVELDRALEGQLSILNELAPSDITSPIEERMRKEKVDLRALRYMRDLRRSAYVDLRQ